MFQQAHNGGSAPAKAAGRISKTAAYYLAFVALGMTTAALGPALPYLADQTGSLLSAISFLFTTRSLGYLLGSLQGGRLYDRVQGHPVMAAALVVMAVTMALVPLTPQLWLLIAIFLILGVAEAALDVGGNTLLVWVHHHRVGPFMNGLHFFFGVGAFLSPIILAQAVLACGGIGLAFWALALLALPVAFWLLYLPSPMGDVAADGQRNRSASRGKTGLLVALFALFLFLYVGAEIGFGGWIFSYAMASGLSSVAGAAALTSAFWGALTVGRLLGIPLAARFKPESLLLSDLLGCLVSVGIILIWPELPGSIWIGTLGLGLSMASIFPVTISLAELRMTITGQVTGWLFAGASAGGLLLPWLMGQLFEGVTPRATMFAILLDLLLALGVYAALMSYSARHTTDEGRRTGN